MTPARGSSLYVLGNHGQTVDGSANDVRGRRVDDESGDTVGTVADLLVDQDSGKVRFLLIEHGGLLGFGEKRSLVPVDAISSITEDRVMVDRSGEHLASAPAYSPDLVDDRPHHRDVYSHYGCAPFWDEDDTFPSGLAMLPTSPPPDRRLT